MLAAYCLTQDFMGMKEGDVVHLSPEDAEKFSDYVKEATPEDLSDEGDAEATDMETPEDAENENMAVRAIADQVMQKLDKVINKPSVKATAPALPAQSKDPNCGFTGMGDFLRCLSFAHRGNYNAIKKLDAYSRLSKKEWSVKSPAGADEGTSADGGYLVIPTWADQIWRRVESKVNLYSMCTEYPVSGNTVKLPVINESSRADASRFGGVVSGYYAEGGAFTVGKAAYGEVDLVIKKLGVFLPFTNELLADAAYPIDKFSTEIAGDEIRFCLNRDIIKGGGTTDPQGILNSAALVTVTKESGQSGGTVWFPNIVKMYARMHQNYYDGAVWLVSQPVYTQLLQMTFPNSSGTFPANGLTFDARDEYPMRIFGKPVITCEACTDVGTIGDILFVNLVDYGVTKKPLQVAVSTEYAFNTDQTYFRFNVRWDAKSRWLSALTPYNSSGTVSHLVALGSGRT